MPEDVRARHRAALPREGAGLAGAYDAFRRDVLPYRYGNIHPRFWGWVNGSALPSAVLADFLASAMNSNVGAFDQSAVAVEEQVLGWLRELFQLPSEGEGVLTSGGSVANLLALAAARHAHAPGAREHGLAERRLTLYGSVETHSSIDKAVELLGLGRTCGGTGRRRISPAAGVLEAPCVRRARAQALRAGGERGTVNTERRPAGRAGPLRAAREAVAAWTGLGARLARERKRALAGSTRSTPGLQSHSGCTSRATRAACSRAARLRSLLDLRVPRAPAGGSRPTEGAPSKDRGMSCARFRAQGGCAEDPDSAFARDPRQPEQAPRGAHRARAAPGAPPPRRSTW
jgi:hypothetical protein